MGFSGITDNSGATLYTEISSNTNQAPQPSRIFISPRTAATHPNAEGVEASSPGLRWEFVLGALSVISSASARLTKPSRIRAKCFEPPSSARHTESCSCTTTQSVIGHLKSDFRMGRNFLSGVLGDAMNVMLAFVSP